MQRKASEYHGSSMFAIYTDNAWIVIIAYDYTALCLMLCTFPELFCYQRTPTAMQVYLKRDAPYLSLNFHNKTSYCFTNYKNPRSVFL